MESLRGRDLNWLGRTRASLRLALRAPVHATLRLCEPYRAARTKHELAVCAIFREEARFLDEWISFHVGVGVTHFYLYDNFSTDNFNDVLAPWIERGYVTVTAWPVAGGQVAAYLHCARRARGDCRWLAFIDIDEFLFSPSIVDIRPILARYADLPAVEVWQVFFGSGGHVSRPSLPVTESYVMRAPLTRNSAKSIVNPRMIYKPGIHQCKYWIGQGGDTSRRVVTRDRTMPVLDILRINHYWSRSLEDLQIKATRGDAAMPGMRNRDWHFDFEKSLNAERDEAILPIARAIRDAPARWS
jgi:Glycosyltransferase family 92